MRLIDADALLAFEKFDAQIEEHTEKDVLMIIQTAPTIDPVHAAGGCYCRECKWYDSDTGVCWWTSTSTVKNLRDEDNFCSDGEAREAKDDAD